MVLNGVIDRKILYIIFACLISLLILGLFFAPIIRKIYYRNRFKKRYYKVIDKLVIDEDYLLINNFIIKNCNIFIDHIIFAKKYIYLVKDSYFEGAIEGKIKDNKWVYYPYRRRDVLTVDNPYISLNDNLDSLTKLVGLDPQLFHLIFIINDDVLTNIEKNKIKNYTICTKSTLKKSILDIENTAKLKDINQKDILKAANDISRINERRKRKYE